jgi:hypothetical protein
MEWTDEDRQWFRERQAIQEAQRHEAARWGEQNASTLMAQQPELWKHPTYQTGDWGVYEEQRQEAQSNALEAQLAREHAREQARLSQER